MKTKLLASTLCVVLLLFAITGCGLKMPATKGASPSPDASDSAGSVSVPAKISVLTGLVSAMDGNTVTLDLLKPYNAQTAGTSDEAPDLITSGSAVFTKTVLTQTVTVSDSTAIILSEQGYIAGDLGDIADGDFLAVAMNGDAAIALVDNGPGGGVKSGSGSDEAVPPVTADAPATDGGKPQAAIPDSPEAKTYTVDADDLNVRSGPGTKDTVLGKLVRGAEVTGTVKDGWLKFTFNGKTAYCKADFLAVAAASAAGSEPASGVPDSSKSAAYKVSGDNVNVRSGPGTAETVLGKLAKGTEVTGTVKDGWLKFTYEGKTAYCKADYLTPAE